ncbi:MAG: hypothetical protein KAY32_07070 [Candidatus Eisenbacteria sp.]|nr:hypothetical protein [Candidatus Eisenbacteria bacterium]
MCIRHWSILLGVSATVLLGCSDDPNTTPSIPTVHLVAADGSGDFPTIQAAIDSAADGEIIELADGTFTGDGNRDLSFAGKAITLRSRSGDPETCVIDCQADTSDLHRAFLFQGQASSRSVLESLTMTNGISSFGGAVFCSSGAGPRIRNCVFRGNSALHYGGAIWCKRGAAPTIESCIFESNSSSHDGGSIAAAGAAPTIVGCSFSDCSADWTGGAIASLDNARCSISRCCFSGNYARFGAAVSCEFSGPILTDCLFTDNTARWCGGGIHCHAFGYALIDHCTFVGNHAVCGGCVSSDWGGQPHLRYCTLYGNSAERGAGVECESYSSIVLTHCIIAGSASGNAVQCRNEGTWIGLAHCNLFGNAGGDWVDCAADQRGLDCNMSVDPLFCDPENRVFTLYSSSPCLRDSLTGRPIGAWGIGCE